MKITNATQETSVDCTATHDPAEAWNDLLERLQVSLWIDEAVVRAEWERLALERKLAENPATVNRLMLLTKLRLALIETQVRSSPDSYPGASAVFQRNEHARDMLRFFAQGELPEADALVRLEPHEEDAIRSLEREMAEKSRAAVESDRRGMVWLTLGSRRLPRAHARIFRTEDAIHHAASLLQAVELPCSGAPIRREILDSDWQLVRNAVAARTR